MRVRMLAATLLVAAGFIPALHASTRTPSALVQLTPIAVDANRWEVDDPASAAIDGDFYTRWRGSGVGAHLTLDFGAARTITQVRIAFYNGNARVYGFQIQSSHDGERYTSAGSFISSGTTSMLETFDIEASGRYLRIFGWGNDINRDNTYNEVQAYASGP